MPIDVFIVEDHLPVRSLLEQLVLKTKGFELAGSCGLAEEAMVLIPDFLPQVVLMDIHLPGNQNGTDAIRMLKPVCPQVLFLVCTIYEDDENILQALQAGASGYLVKGSDPEMITSCIRELCAGGSPMTPSIARKVIDAFRQMSQRPRTPEAADAPAAPLTVLSSRENEILQWLSRGFLYKEIAAALFISQETVRKHVYHIYEKLRVGNRVEAVNKYFRR